MSFPPSHTVFASAYPKVMQIGWATIATSLTVTGLTTAMTTAAIAQIVPDDTLGQESSVVTPSQWGEWQGDRIDGGAIRGRALFHSFEEFNIQTGQAAYFANPAGIEAILSRVTGQNRSDIFGRLGVLGRADLFLLNPNGIVFGPDASLDVAGSFVATTADRFTFANHQFFSATDPTAPPLLTMNLPAPGLQYGVGQSGPVINAADLAVNAEENLTLTGETVVSTGSLTAPGGEVAIAAISGPTSIQLGDRGQIREITSLADLHLPTDLNNQPLSETTPESIPEMIPDIVPETIPEIVANTGIDLGLVLTDGGGVAIASTNTLIPIDTGDTIISGELNTANFATGELGGQIAVGGDRVALVDGAVVNATGDSGGGNVLIGGTYQGRGSFLNAQQTYIGSDATISADAMRTGNGGTVIVWADGQTSFYGSISARGGSTLGDGGFVEVSGKQHLVFRGDVALETVDGLPGTLLLDPTNIIIADGDGAADDNQIDDGAIFNDEGAGTFTISEVQLEELEGDFDVILEATNNITLADLTDDELDFQPGDGAIAFIADADGNGVGAFTMTDLGDGDGIADTILTNGRNLSITGASLTIGNIDTSRNTTIAIDLDPFPADNPNGSIPTEDTLGVATFTFTVTNEETEGATVQDVNIEFSAEHTYVGDLTASLSNPGSTTVVLFDGVGEDGQDFDGTVLDDEASVSIEDAEAPFQGTFQPQGTLGNFDGQNSEGTWTLTVEDTVVEFDSGQLIAADTQLLLRTDTAVADGGNIALTATNGDISARELIASSQGGVGGNITLNATGGDIMLVNSEIVSNSVAAAGSDFSSIDIFAAGTVTLENSEVSVENTSDGLAGDILINAGERVTIGDSVLSSNGNFGRIFIGLDENDAPQTVDITASQVTASNSNIDGTQRAGNINIFAQDSIFIGDQSIISSDTVGEADGGSIVLTAGDNITVDGGFDNFEDDPPPNIDVSTSGNGAGGDLQLDAPTVELRNGAIINASTTANGAGGNILIGPLTENDGLVEIDTDVAIANRTVTLQSDAIIQANAVNPDVDEDTSTVVTGDGGLITIRASDVSLNDSDISTRVQLEASGAGGNIEIDANQIRLTNESSIDAGTSGRLIDDDPDSASGGEVVLTSANGIELETDSIISVATELSGRGGQIDLDAQYVSLQSNSVLDASTRGDNTGGGIFIETTGTNSFETVVETGALATDADTNTQTENFGVFLDSSTIFTVVDTGATAQGGNVEITTEALAIRNGARIEAQTRGFGDAGAVVLEVSRLLDIRGTNGGFNSGILASSETPSSGEGGNITINETTPQGTLTLDQNGFLSASTRSDISGAGDILINVENLSLLNGGQILAASVAGTNAGDIAVNATNQIIIDGLGTEETTASPFTSNNNAVPTTLEFSSAADTGLQTEFDGASYASRPNESGNNAFAYFSFQVTEADSRGIFDIDNGFTDGRDSSIDTELFLFDQQTGELLAANDDDDISSGAGGSSESFDSFIDFTFADSGDYVIGVGQFDSEATDGALIIGDFPETGQTYDLRVSLANAANGQTSVNGANPNPNRGLGSNGETLVNSGLLALANNGGNAGSITVNTPTLTLTNGGAIAVSSTNGSGIAGDIDIIATTVTLQDGGAIAAETDAGGDDFPANISLSGIQRLTVENSLISSSTQSGSAGNVGINIEDTDTPANTVIVSGPNSGIAAEANVDGGDAGNVELNVQNLTVSNNAEISTSNISSDRDDSLTGVTLSNVEQLQATAGGAITASTETGRAGNIFINQNSRPADSIVVRGNNARIAARATEDGGNAGDVDLNTRELRVLTGGRITASTQTGLAGNVEIIGGQGDRPVNTVIVRGIDEEGRPSRISARATESGGSAGDVDIAVRNLTVSDGAEITASNVDSAIPSSIRLSDVTAVDILTGGRITTTTQTGEAGNVRVTGQLNDNGQPIASIMVNGTDERGRRSAISAQATQDGGNAGDVIFLNISDLSILDGAEVTAATRTGTAGDIRVNTNATPANTILISGEDSLLAVEAKGPRSSTTIGGTNSRTNRTTQERATEITTRANGDVLGVAGDLLLFTRNLTVADDGVITVESATGIAGNLAITANAILLDSGTLTASTAVDDPDGDSANIILNLGRYSLFPSSVHQENSLILQNESRIEANAGDIATGGNITINTLNGYVTGVNPTGPMGSDITANAGVGNGGRVDIGAIALFGIEFRAAQTPFNDITATSAQGQAGTVTVQTLVSEFEPGTINLQSGLLNTPPLESACGNQRDNESNFRIVGRGGLPPRPSDTHAAPLLFLPWLEQGPTLDTPSEAETIDGASTRAPSSLDLNTLNTEFLATTLIRIPFPNCVP